MGIDDFVTKGLEVKQKIKNMKQERDESIMQFRERHPNTPLSPPFFRKKKKELYNKLEAIEKKYQSKIDEFERELEKTHEQCPFYNKGCDSGYLPYIRSFLD